MGKTPDPTPWTTPCIYHGTALIAEGNEVVGTLPSRDVFTVLHRRKSYGPMLDALNEIAEVDCDCEPDGLGGLTSGPCPKCVALDTLHRIGERDVHGSPIDARSYDGKGD